MTSVAATPLQHGDAAELLRGVALGSQADFATLYDRFAPLVLHVCRAGLPDPLLAERATEAVFLDVWRRAARWEPGTSDALEWILDITYRAVALHRRP